MDTGGVPGSSVTMGVVLKQAQLQSQIQMAVLKQAAEMQQRMAEMLQAVGVGQNVDISA